ENDAALAHEGEVDAAAADDDPESAADDPEAHPRAAPDGRGVALVLRPLVAGDDRPRAVSVDGVVDRDRALGEAPDHAAAALDRDDPARVLDRERAVVRSGRARGNAGRQHERHGKHGKGEEWPHGPSVLTFQLCADSVQGKETVSGPRGTARRGRPGRWRRCPK